MKAVNLIPSDQRKGAGGAAGRAGGAVYVLVGGLAALVLLSVVYAISASQVSDRQSKLTRVTSQADVVQSQATSLQPYVTFASIRQTREQAVAAVAASRFDWSAAMDQIARALPTDVTLSALTGGPTAAGPTAPVTAPPAPAPPAPAGTTPPPAASPAPSGTTPPAAAAAAAVAPVVGPTVALTGCATTHSEVATVLVDLHRIVGVTGVSLSNSTKATTAAAPSAANTCPGATFTASLVYAASAATVAPTTSPAGATAQTATPSTPGSTR
ncbi:MAG: hypothetical protein ACR2KV_15785 [Solirubrobacteraceae bacterium]